MVLILVVLVLVVVLVVVVALLHPHFVRYFSEKTSCYSGEMKESPLTP